ncbi:uncharacterized protein LOC111456538 isoform X2 [Cucurbita moschata]|uniref:Uncharacterized protein LOC111456538 isoform X2 n=1 Tax=Cucurbita moschata TaxID=3662 RepID=A0A6J1GRU8_CUCMO|nr:uncharacterized protein LOC111456538 isoform X2 [Cucurbita moschata]
MFYGSEGSCRRRYGLEIFIGVDFVQWRPWQSTGQNEVLHVPCSLADMNETKNHEHVVPSIRRLDQGVQCLSQLLEGGDLREKELREETYSHRLITIVHDHISASDQIKHLQSSSTKGSADEVERMEMTSLQSLENDQIATFIWNLEPCILQKFLLTTAVISFDFPITFTRLKLFSWKALRKLVYSNCSGLINILSFLIIEIDA